MDRKGACVFLAEPNMSRHQRLMPLWLPAAHLLEASPAMTEAALRQKPAEGTAASCDLHYPPSIVSTMPLRGACTSEQTQKRSNEDKLALETIVVGRKKGRP